MSARGAIGLALSIALFTAAVTFAMVKPRPGARSEGPRGAGDSAPRATTASALTVAVTSSAAAAPVASVASVASVAPVASPASVASNALAPTSATSEEDRIEDDLRRATLESLKLRADPTGATFDATIALRGREGREGRELHEAELSIALIEDPYAYRRPLAFYRLAKALGARVVRPSVVRRVAVGDLAALAAGDATAMSLLQARASIQNDGTVDALLSAPGAPDSGSVWRRPGADAREIALSGAPEIETWAAWARSIGPAPSERTSTLRGYVEMLVLDYLSANALRRSVTLDEASGSLTLVESSSAFPLHWDAAAEALLLARLRDVQRFPKGLLERLSRFDRAAAAAALTPGAFETWLVSPRNVVALDERRASLMTLIEARISEGSAASALSL